MGDVDLEPLETTCSALFEELGGTWDWDGRFASAVLAYGRDRAEEVLAAVKRFTPHSWTSDGLGDAPEVVQELVKTFGSLYPGQTFLCSATEGAPIIVAALWPWGDGKRISLRLGCASHGLDDAARVEAAAAVKRCFQVA